MDIEESNNHRGILFLRCEAVTDFVVVVIGGNNLGERMRHTSTDKVFPTNGVLVRLKIAAGSAETSRGAACSESVSESWISQ